MFLTWPVCAVYYVHNGAWITVWLFKAAYESSSTLFFSALFGRNEELPIQVKLIQHFLTARPASRDSKNGLYITPATKVIRYNKMTLVLLITLLD
jgi:hypothetical protein